ncbi:trafficking protein particle complex subunit 10 [Stachybotrys elegans]|uniref:Trafficking protein particle complex subunit 10 n=1 Tax=Stachybotrys elegans TaxID=80388 RepID=A0A8K0SMM2_9HYPO|nr:trafficking protein particle complex subunit 10 [Stachybotrys elegans]
MEQQSSTSKVTVEYFDPHDVYKLLAPGLNPRFPLRNLHWQSHAGPLRSIDTLHVELVQGGDDASPVVPSVRQSSSTATDDGFQTQNISGRAGSTEAVDAQSLPSRAVGNRRHQIPGLRSTPYLKVLFVRCDDNDSYKNSVRAEIREWVKTNTAPAVGSKKNSTQENHDAFEFLIVHVVLPNTVAATQPRSSGKSESSDKPVTTTTSRWRTGSTPLMEKLRSDFNGSTKGGVDHIAQIRIGINDVPYDQLPRVVPAVPSGYSETDQDALNAWNELMGKFKSLILSSFDLRVSQYEEDIKEKDSQRLLPGWNFCTFFMLKEGLARGFENVGLVEDALVGYDELSVGLDAVIQEQAQPGSPTTQAGALLNHSADLKKAAEKALAEMAGEDGEDEEAVDLQSREVVRDDTDDIIISPVKKPYRDMILANNVSVFDFRCYIFSRQIALLLRLANALTSRDELLAKLRDERDSLLHDGSLLTPAAKQKDAAENLSVLAEICRRALEFIPAASQVMRSDIVAAMPEYVSQEGVLDPLLTETVDNIVASFAFSVAHQILAQTATSSLPLPPSLLGSGEHQDAKMSIPEPKTMMHPARSATGQRNSSSRDPPPSPGIFPGPGQTLSSPEVEAHHASVLKTGLEELAAKRAELYELSRSILDGMGKKRGWSDGWEDAPMMGDGGIATMQEISLDDDAPEEPEAPEIAQPSTAGVHSQVLRTAMESTEDFYRMYQVLTDKSQRHYTVANQDHAVQANIADLAVLRLHLKDYKKAADYFNCTTPFYGDSGWSMLELSMLIMYSKCLKELQSKDGYVRVALKLLTKACAAEDEQLRQRSAMRLKGKSVTAPDLSPIEGVVEQLLSYAQSLSSEAKVPLANFFTRIELTGAPVYHDGRDSCTLSFKLWSLLPEEMAVDRVLLKLTTVDGGPCKEIVFEKKANIRIVPGNNTVQVDCNSIVPSKYVVTHLSLGSSKLLLYFDRSALQPPPRTTDIFRRPDVTLYQRAGGLDAQLTATKHTALDRNNSFDLTLSTGWNTLRSCEVRVKPATGGLRLLTTATEIVNAGAAEFTRPPEAGIFALGAIGRDASVTLRFPYSIEQDFVDVLARVEVTYHLDSDSDETPFYLAKSLSVPISLVLGVNVQDVFKHEAIYSRFTVSAATPSPLRLYRSELLASDLFESAFGVPPQRIVTVFPKQPATLMYRIRRRPGAKALGPSNRPGKTMYLKLHYSLLHTEITDALRASLTRGLEDEGLEQYARVLVAHFMREVPRAMHPQDLERSALLGEIDTSFLADVPWEQRFQDLGIVPGTSDTAAARLASFLIAWQKSHPRVPLPTSPVPEPWSILIPVEIPSLPIVHTADLRLHLPEHHAAATDATPTTTLNQLIPATLHLKWTRIWDTDLATRDDQEFSYEVAAPADTWLLGGRRRGHFVIPAASGAEGMASTPETEAEIPLMLIPLREGYLPYPGIEIREVATDEAAAALPSQSCEVDWRNLGESVRVLGGKKSVTVSLDASGPGGGPLVLESEALPTHSETRIVA